MQYEIGPTLLEPSGLAAPIRDYFAARRLPPFVFAELFGSSFLVRFGPPAEQRGVAETTREVPLCDVWDDPPQLLVHAVKPYRDAFVTVGRAANNRVIIDDLSVSKLHATIRREPDGTHIIRDAGSLNGTFIDDERVVKETIVNAGSQLRFGSVATLFVDAQAFQQLLVRMS